MLNKHSGNSGWKWGRELPISSRVLLLPQVAERASPLFSQFILKSFSDFYEALSIKYSNSLKILLSWTRADLSGQIRFITDDKMKWVNFNTHIGLDSLYLSEKEKIRVFSLSFVPTETRQTVTARTKYSDYSFFSWSCLTQLQSLNLYYFWTKPVFYFDCQLVRF